MTVPPDPASSKATLSKSSLLTSLTPSLTILTTNTVVDSSTLMLTVTSPVVEDHNLNENVAVIILIDILIRLITIRDNVVVRRPIIVIIIVVTMRIPVLWLWLDSAAKG